MSVAASNAVHLSRGFDTTPSSDEMSRVELVAKSGAALSVGLLPFLCSMITMPIFKGMARLAARTDHQAGRTLCAVIGIPAGAAMIGSAKVFGISQQLVWRKYAKNPVEDGPNQRLAWYGLSQLPGKDLSTLTKAFLSPAKLSEDEWSLERWAQLSI